MVQSSSREDRNTEAILSHLDVPAEPQLTVVDTCVIRGWACSVNSIAGVEIFVDGARVQRFVPDSDRPDEAGRVARAGRERVAKVHSREAAVRRREAIWFHALGET